MKVNPGSKCELVVGCELEVLEVVGGLETGHRLRRVGCISEGAVESGVEAESSSGDCEFETGGGVDIGAGGDDIGR